MYNYANNSDAEIKYLDVCSIEDIPTGERILLEIGGLPIVIFNIAGSLYAIADLCSHDDGPVGEGEIDGSEVICPRHGGRFNIKTGAVTRAPAVEDIPAYPIHILDGKVQIGIPIKMLV